MQTNLAFGVFYWNPVICCWSWLGRSLYGYIHLFVQYVLRNTTIPWQADFYTQMQSKHSPLSLSAIRHHDEATPWKEKKEVDGGRIGATNSSTLASLAFVHD